MQKAVAGRGVIAAVAALAAVYFAAGKAGLLLASVHPNASAVWPPTGIAIAALLVFGYRLWPGIFIGALLVSVTTAGSLLSSLGIALGNTLESVAAAWLVNRYASGARAFERPQDVFRYTVLAGVLSTTISASFGVGSLTLAGFAGWADAGRVWLTWWLGDMGGALIVAPLLILWATSPPRLPYPRAAAESGAVLALLALTALAVFGGWQLFADDRYPLPYLTLPFLLWAAFRFGPTLTATAVALLAAIAVGGTVQGLGPFAWQTQNESLLLVQTFLGTVAVMALMVAAAVWEWQRAVDARARLATIVESSDDAILSAAPDGAVTSWNRGAERLYGYRAAEIIGRPVTLLVPEERRAEVAAFNRQVAGGERIEDYETVHQRKDGSRFDVAVSVSPVRDRWGAIVGAAAIVRDITERKHAEDALRQSHWFLEMAQQVGKAGGWIADPGPAGKLVWSKELYRIWGMTEGQFDGRVETFLQTVHPDDRAAVLQASRAALFEGAPYDLDHRIVRPDGTVRWVHEQATVLRDEIGAPVKIIGMAQDITERKEAEEALRESEERYRATAEAASDAIITIDEQGMIVACNSATERIFGYRPDELLGQDLTVLMPEGLRARYRAGLARNVATGERRLAWTGLQMPGRHRDGHAVPLEISFGEFTRGNQRFIVGVVRDVTERQRAEEVRALLTAMAERARADAEAHQRRLQAVLDQIPEGVAIADVASGALAWNNAGKHLAPFAVEEIAAWRETAFWHSDGRVCPFDEVPLVRALHGETVLSAELVFAREDGSRRTLLVNAAPVLGQGGKTAAAVMVFQDITQRKSLEQLKDQFLSLAAHELKTPITSIRGNAQLLLRSIQRGQAVTERQAGLLESIEERTKFMAGLIEELLDLSRIETGRLTLRREPADLADVVRSAVALQQQLHPGAVLTLRDGGGPVMGIWDRGRLDQVFNNLLDNAVKYNAAGQPVIVTLTADDTQAEVSVQDFGIGIPAADLPHLFERHFRGSNVDRSPTGLGLGLYLSSEIVRRHGGSIRAASTEGRGTTFTVILPRRPSGADMP